jgi:hypothetical protein
VTRITRFSRIAQPLPTHRALLLQASAAAAAGAARRRDSSGDAENTFAYAVTGPLATRRADHVLVAAARTTTNWCEVQRSTCTRTVRSSVSSCEHAGSQLHPRYVCTRQAAAVAHAPALSDPSSAPTAQRAAAVQWTESSMAPFVYQQKNRAARAGAEVCEIYCKRAACNIQHCLARLVPNHQGQIDQVRYLGCGTCCIRTTSVQLARCSQRRGQSLGFCRGGCVMHGACSVLDVASP